MSLNLFINSGVAASSGFSPAQLSDLKLWLDASDSSTITESLNAVSQWNDKSGNANSLTQTTASLKPKTNTRTLNNKNVIEFDGGDIIRSAAFSSVLSQPNTVFIVYQSDLSSLQYVLDGLSPGTDRHLFVLDPAIGDFMFAGTELATSHGTPSIPYLVSLQFNTTSSEYYINGSLVASGNVGSQGFGGITLGSRYNDVTFFDGIIGEVIVYDKLLSISERQKVETYLKDKWIPVPQQISGLNVWLDADDSSTITESSNLVSQWNDKSGNGNHVSQANASEQPLTNTNTIGGKNALSFDGGDILSANYTVSSGSLTIFIVNKIDVLTSIFERNFAISRTTTTEGLINGGANSSTFFMGSRHPENVLLTSTSNTSPNILSYIKSGANSQTFYINGVLVDSDTSGITTFTSQKLEIGGHSSDPIIRHDGQIGEFIVYDRALTTTEREQIESYLSDKWGI
jgi:hypothetical protein